MIRYTMVIYRAFSVYTVVCAWTLFSSVMDDMNSLVQSPIPRYSDNKESESELLMKRTKELKFQRRHLVVSNSLGNN